MTNILITGSAGFIGRRVSSLLYYDDNTIIHRVDMLEPRVHGRRPAMDWHDESVMCQDISDDTLADADVVVHLAAQVGVADSARDPYRYVDGNVLDTTLFLDRLAKHGDRLRRLVVASSMSVYGDPQTDPIREDHPINPESVYGLTKYDQERLCMLWGRDHNVEVIALRYFNVYGPGQALRNPYTGVLANFANWLLKGESPRVYEDGHQTRDFIHVSDVAHATAAAARGNLAPGVYNVCTGRAQKLIDVAGQMTELLAPGTPIDVTGTKRPGDVRHVRGDAGRLAGQIFWDPVPFEDGIVSYCNHLKPQRVPA